MPSWEAIGVAAFILTIMAIVLGSEWLVMASLRKLGRYALKQISTEYDKANKRDKQE